MRLITEQTENIQVLTEEKNGTKDYFIEGIFLQSELKNHNGRVYPKQVMEKEVARYSEKFIKTGRALGELSHPQTCQINPDRVSHLITSLREDGNNYVGKAKVLNTPCGQIVQGLLEGGAQLGVSSRGMGTLKERTDGTVEVLEDFTLATAADIVFDPSGPDCFVDGILEGKEWIFTEGRYIEQDIEHAKTLIENAPARRLDAVKRSAFVDFITKNF